jgi:hypothetical protein
MYEILKPFFYSNDGVTLTFYDAGDDLRSVNDDLSPGLISEGFIKDNKPRKYTKAS